MKEIYIHIGLHKTGTTAIQTALFESAAELAQAGVHVARAGTPPEAVLGQHRLAWAHSRNHELMTCWDDLAAELAAVDAKRIVITSEEFCALKSESIARIGEFFSRRGGAQVIIYLRNQVDLAESVYRTEALHYSVNTPFQDYPSRIRTRLDYDSLLKDWAAAFGLSNIIVRLYEKASLPDGVVPDFCRIIGLDATKLYTPPKNVNHGLPFDAIIPIQQMRKHGIEKPIVDRFVAWAYRHCDSHFTYLSAGEATEFMRRFTDSNNAVAKQFFGRESLFHEYAERRPERLDHMAVMAATLAKAFASR